MKTQKTKGFYDRENDTVHIFIPPAPTESERGGITAKEKTTESLEVTIDSATGKAYVALDKTLSKTGEAADAAVVGEKLTSMGVAIENVKEDLGNKITKFYASNQGETHLADSDNGKIMDMMVYGKSEQEQYSGKNLLNYNAWKGTPITRGTAIYENNGITLTATENDCYSEMGNNFPDNAKIKVSEGETLTLSWEQIENNKEGYIYIFGNGIASNSVNIDNRKSKKLSYTVPSGVTFITFRFGVATTGDTISYKNIQIEKGSEPTTYEPYTGGIPSPNPDYPQEIKSVVNPTVKITNEDKTQFKTVTLPYTLNAIPVSASGNVTIDGQQYIADYVDVERGKLVRLNRFKKITSNDVASINTSKILYVTTHDVWDDPTNYVQRSLTAMSNIGEALLVTVDNSGWNGESRIRIKDVPFANIDEAKSYFGTNDVYCCYPLATPIEIDLTPEEIAAFKALATYYPTTNISVNSEQLDGYTVFNYPISMENGWNYVKQQIGDTRDYIYDMDLQSAEAYVNSEYAVALTELEV